jgi:hypothetical protein
MQPQMALNFFKKVFRLKNMCHELLSLRHTKIKLLSREKNCINSVVVSPYDITYILYFLPRLMYEG